MGNTFYFQWEADLMITIQSLLGSIGGKISSIISIFGEEIMLIVVLGFLYWCYDKKLGVRFGYNLIFTAIAFPVLKNIAVRRRPYMDIEGISCLKPVDKEADIMDIAAQGYSFPSGHSANAATCYGSLAYFFNGKLLRIIGIVIPLIVGISRVSLGNHFPTDVICGWLLGAVSVFCIPRLTAKIKNKKTVYLVVFCVAACGAVFCRSNDYFTSLGMMAGLFVGNLFEERHVDFKPTRDPLFCVLRVAGGGAVYAVLNTLMKLPFSEEFLDSASMGQFLFRFIRYAIIIFLDLAIYPMIFKKFEPWFDTKFRKGKIGEKA